MGHLVPDLEDTAYVEPKLIKKNTNAGDFSFSGWDT